MEEYKGSVFGKLKIPYFSLFEDISNPYSREDVKINVNPQPFNIPNKSVKRLYKKIIREKEDEAKKTGKIFFDGPLARLNNYRVNDDSHSLEFCLQKTSFFTYTSTNRSLDKDIVWKMVKRRGAEYTNLDDGLANPIGCNVLTHTSDGKVVLNKRSEKVSVYPGLYGVLPAGFVDPERDDYNPFNTAKKEAEEEMGVSIKKLELLGFGRAGDDRHIEFLFQAETDYMGLEVKSAPKTTRYEMQEIILAEFTPEKLSPYIKKTVDGVPKGAVRRGDVWIPCGSPAWVPAHVYLLILALMKEYGFEETYNAIGV